MIGSVESRGNGELFQIVPAGSGAAGFFSAGERGEEQAGQDRDNRDDDEQLDKGKPCPALHVRMVMRPHAPCKGCDSERNGSSVVEYPDY